MTLDLTMRPKKFSKMIGNGATIEKLKRIEKWPACVLLTGPTGCGKTTIARIVAGIRDSQTVELNISNTRGIEQARSIIESVRTHSLVSDGKTIVLNECHEATRQFQDAMLEVLEEPPAGVMFILCTTDPQKLLPAVKSRCKIFGVETLNHDESKKLIKIAIKKGDLEINKSLIRDIIVAGEGIPRKILNILETIDGINGDNAKKLIAGFAYVDGSESTEAITLCRLLMKNAQYKDLMTALKEIPEPPETIRRIVCSYMSKVLMGGKVVSNAANALECFADADTTIGIGGIVNAITIIHRS